MNAFTKEVCHSLYSDSSWHWVENIMIPNTWPVCQYLDSEMYYGTLVLLLLHILITDVLIQESIVILIDFIAVEPVRA